MTYLTNSFCRHLRDPIVFGKLFNWFSHSRSIATRTRFPMLCGSTVSLLLVKFKYRSRTKLQTISWRWKILFQYYVYYVPCISKAVTPTKKIQVTDARCTWSCSLFREITNSFKRIIHTGRYEMQLLCKSRCCKPSRQPISSGNSERLLFDRFRVCSWAPTKPTLSGHFTRLEWLFNKWRHIQFTFHHIKHNHL